MAPRYAAVRPDLHSKVVAYLQQLVAAAPPLRAALDVGCGTGLSTRPLRAVAERVVGLDPAPSMLREAQLTNGASYVRGHAEALPFGDAAFGLLTIGCAYHWCDTRVFLAEAVRVLDPQGLLLIYDSFFLGESPRSSALLDWLSSQHWPRLPQTPRNPLPEPGMSPHPSFELVSSCFLETWVPMSRGVLLTYLTTQSGVVASVESGERSLEHIESRLLSGLSALVPEEGAEFRFGGPLWVLRRLP